jgi:hypothetical protein
LMWSGSTATQPRSPAHSGSTHSQSEWRQLQTRADLCLLSFTFHAAGMPWHGIFRQAPMLCKLSAWCWQQSTGGHAAVVANMRI